MDVEPGESWADAVSKILRMGTNNPESNRILSKAVRDKDNQSDSDDDQPEGNREEEQRISKQSRLLTCLTKKLKPDPQRDALLENELKEAATRGVVHLFNAVKTVNPKSDKKKKKRKKKTKKIKKKKSR